MKDATKLLPEDLRSFLSINKGRRIVFDRAIQPEMEVDSLEFYAPNKVKLCSFTIDTLDYYLNHSEPGDDPKLRYEVEGVDLVRDCDHYDPEGILVYFPAFQEYGCWDCDHLIITMYPRVGWSEIEPRLAEYINAQWYPDLAEQYLLRPWADERCSRFRPKPSR
jgi:hypothetical protein